MANHGHGTWLVQAINIDRCWCSEGARDCISIILSYYHVIILPYDHMIILIITSYEKKNKHAPGKRPVLFCAYIYIYLKPFYYYLYYYTTTQSNFTIIHYTDTSLLLHYYTVVSFDVNRLFCNHASVLLYCFTIMLFYCFTIILPYYNYYLRLLLLY